MSGFSMAAVLTALMAAPAFGAAAAKRRIFTSMYQGGATSAGQRLSNLVGMRIWFDYCALI